MILVLVFSLIFAFKTFALAQKKCFDGVGHQRVDVNHPPLKDDNDIKLNKRFDTASFLFEDEVHF